MKPPPERRGDCPTRRPNERLDNKTDAGESDRLSKEHDELMRLRKKLSVSGNKVSKSPRQADQPRRSNLIRPTKPCPDFPSESWANAGLACRGLAANPVLGDEQGCHPRARNYGLAHRWDKPLKVTMWRMRFRPPSLEALVLFGRKRSVCPRRPTSQMPSR